MKASFRWYITVFAIVLVSVFILSSIRTGLCAPAYDAEKERAYFKGKLVTTIIPSKAGGWFDTCARLLQAPLQERLPGSKAIVENVPGAGRKTAMNRLFAAKPDGTTLAIVNRANAIGEMIGEPGIRFKFAEYTWLANTINMARFLFVSSKSPYKTFQDFITSKKKIKLGATGVGSVSWYDNIILKKMFNKDNFEMVPGYEGSNDVYRAIVQGEIDATIAVEIETVNLPREDINILLQCGGPKGYFPGVNVPTLSEVSPPSGAPYVKLIDAQFYLARFWAAPPKMEPNRAKFLRDTFEEICKDPKFLASMKKAGARVDFTRGERIQELVKEHMNAPREVIDLFKETEAGEVK